MSVLPHLGPVTTLIRSRIAERSLGSGEVAMKGSWRGRAVLLVTVGCVAQVACGDSGPVEPQSLIECEPIPALGRPTLFWLLAPFEGQFPMTGYFDHDLPITYGTSRDTNGFVLPFCGTHSGGQDGHPGYDWSLPLGTPLLAVADGVVLQAGEGPPQFCQALNRVTTGQLVLLGHEAPTGEEFVSLVGHMSEVSVTVGEHVTAGQRVGASGSTGCSLGPHVHFEVGRVTGTRRIQIDPYGWNGNTTDPWAVHPDGAASIWLWKQGQAPSVAP
jgi:murein DD-endopeptidase MepM/ murein hydrolase activator NlpD